MVINGVRVEFYRFNMVRGKKYKPFTNYILDLPIVLSNYKRNCRQSSICCIKENLFAGINCKTTCSQFWAYSKTDLKFYIFSMK